MIEILYLANHGNKVDDDTEGHILKGLRELGSTVYQIHESTDRSILGLDADWLLFHKWYNPELLKKWHKKSAFWYFDKVEFNGSQRSRWMRDTIPLVTKGFLTDGTWLRENPSDKLKLLRQGCGEKLIPSNKQFSAKLAFTGTLYAGRAEWYKKLENRHKGQITALRGVHNEDLYAACAQIPIFVAPPSPSDDRYWSSRVYMTLGAGGFLLHPYCKELAKEFKDKVDLVYYRSQGELERYIDYYLAHPKEREAIKVHGFKTCHTKFSYKNRCQNLLKAIQRQ